MTLIGVKKGVHYLFGVLYFDPIVESLIRLVDRNLVITLQ
jgi:hypothetical protein